MDKQEEFTKMIEQSNDGWWFPFTIVGSILSVVIMLLIYIWNLERKKNDERYQEAIDRNKEQEQRHKEHEETINKLTNVITRLTVLTERSVEDIKELKSR